MAISAISAIPHVAAPYPARVSMLDENRPAWEAERAAQNFAARQAQRTAQAQAARDAQRVERAQADRLARAEQDAPPVRHKADPAVAPLALIAPAINIDELRDLYADARMRRAVEDFAARPDPVAQRADIANDWGTIEGLAPLQPYRVAMGNPQVELQAAAVMKAASAGIPAVANIGPTENVTDNARYRPGQSRWM
ncbi:MULTISPECIES: hypothetical protein [Achromobacter]|uniref:Uncharacterized protein n=1 Tax=Achromobacter animicus TaxID=1389935 RepID=A0A6S7A234_9BURK|nr:MULTISPECIES: hypothetical protein [Achromobacter]MBV7499353.1 hypothetical protein [Achromobacter sp. ACM05]CAB3672116.1 hypothetical protein LMG26690_01127 [Achromobacter animicus]